MYLESFTLPADEERLLDERAYCNGNSFGYIDNPYPCRLFSSREFSYIRFQKITIFYGGNGSGKSTLLNLIAERLKLKRIAPFNSGEMFAPYAACCQYEPACDDEGRPLRIPDESRILTSDDIFDHMLAIRASNDEISENKQIARGDWGELRYGDTVRFSGMQDYEKLRLQILARRKTVSRRQFIKRTAGEEVRMHSNGETALRFFQTNLKEDTLYCLDEPENSLSPKMQLELVRQLEEMARYCGCQFILATHSPFLLALGGALIYDLDETPVAVRSWWELGNIKVYYEFFKRHQKYFE